MNNIKTEVKDGSPEEATKAVTLLNGLISLAKEEPTVTP